MKFGIDAHILTRAFRTGTEVYARALLIEMMYLPLREGEEVILYTSAPVLDFPALPKGWRWREIHAPLGRGFTHIRLSIELFLHPVDVFFSPAHEIPLFTGKAKSVGVIPDIAFRFFPELYPRKARKRQEWALRHLISKAEKVLTVSEASVQDLLRETSLTREKVFVTPLALAQKPLSKKSDEEVLAHYGVKSGSYLFTLSRLEKKKNIAALIRAYHLYVDRESDPKQLLLGGSFGFGKEEIEEEIRQTKSGDILTPGYIPDEDAEVLLRHATAYLFPSLYEGFGLPVLEAFSAKVPLICSSIPALQEVAGDAALFFSPNDILGLAESLHRITHDEDVRRALIMKGEERLKDFSFRKTAQMTFDILRTLAYERRH